MERSSRARRSLSVVAAAAAAVAGVGSAPTFLPSGGAAAGCARLASLPTAALRRPEAATSAGTPGVAAAAVAVAAAGSAAVAAPSRRAGAAAKRRQGLVALRAWPWEDDDPYAKCTALKLQIGLQFSKPLLERLNQLADTADTSSDEGLHQLLLDVIVALRRSESAWRYGHCERILSDSEDEGRAASGTLQRWGIEGQSKWGDGEDWAKMDRNVPAGMTEYLVLTMCLSCYGTICPDVAPDKDLKVFSLTDVKKVLDAMSGVQVDELMQLDVQWIPEEEGDSLSGMEMTMKFPELVAL